MDIDGYKDAQLAAVAALVRAAVVADVGPEALESVHDVPMDLNEMAGTRLPAMCIYRADEKAVHRYSGVIDDVVTVRFDYVLPAVNLVKRHLRWPVLTKVWHTLRNTVYAGSHASASAGTEILELAGVDAAIEPSIRAQVKYSFAQQGSTYPFFRGDIDMMFAAEAVDVTALDDFLLHHSSFAAPGDPDHDVVLAEDETALPASGL